MDWLVASFKTGANQALLGVFIGEFIASERGLARAMIDAGSLYNVKRVLSSALMFMLVALLLMAIADSIYRYRSYILRWISVPAHSR
jgi:ABC-type nitrate/sulfonate/bicarbonate transport system permease component